MTRVKICGITNIEDALVAATSGADALGFIFTSSPRHIEPVSAREIIEQLSPFVTTVGVFMNERSSIINEICDITHIDVVQLHGEEPPDFCRYIKRRIIKRFAIDKNEPTESLYQLMKTYRASAYLIDPGCGSGQTFNWHIIKNIDLPLVIAGGLNMSNVKEMVRILNPYGIDVCSGVEESPGKKDHIKLKDFIREVKSC